MCTYTQGGTSCPVYPWPVTSHSLLVLEASTRDMVVIVIDDRIFMLELKENSQYFFYVIIINDVGTVQTSSVQICKYDPWMNIDNLGVFF